MSREEEAIEWLESLNYDMGEETQDVAKAIRMGIKALELISHLIDRPCEACEYHKQTGCSQWSCVFEEVKADADSD